MKISYRSGLDCNYLVLSDISDARLSDFSVRMLSSNSVNGLLKFAVESLNGESCLLYDISGKQSFLKTFEFEKMSAAVLKNFINSLSSLSKGLSEYLLGCENILLDQECIFSDHSKTQFFFCYFPANEYDYSQGLKKLFNDILSLIDYSDPDAVALAYNLNRAALSDNCTLSELAGIINETAAPKAPAEVTEEDFTAAEPAPPPPEAPGFFQKAKVYFEGKKFQEVFDDINEGKIFRKIRETEAEFPHIPQSSLEQHILPPDPVMTFREDNHYLEDPAGNTSSINLAQAAFHNLKGTGGSCVCIELSEFPFTIGKLPSCTFCLDLPTISRNHCRLSQDDSGISIEDLNSTNGVYINNERIPAYSRRSLHSGDLVRLAGETFLFN